MENILYIWFSKIHSKLVVIVFILDLKHLFSISNSEWRSSNGTWYFKSFCFSKTFKNHYMIKYLKSVGVLLFLSTVCNGTVYANQEGLKSATNSPAG